MGTKVFKFGARMVPENSLIRVQMQLGHKYYNSLVEAENKRRAQIWGAEKCPEPPTHDHPEEKCKVCHDHYADIRRRMRETPPLDIKPLRAVAIANGLYWGTYLLIEEAFSAAWKKTKATDQVKFRSWRQGQVMGVQVQQKTKPNAAYQIAAIEDPRTGRRRSSRHAIRLRIGSNGRAPVWSENISYEQHRSLEGRVTWVKIHREMLGDREIWSVMFTCNEVPETPQATTGTVAIDVGWRELENGSIRIAYAHGDDNLDREFTMSTSWRELSSRADRIRSERQRLADEIISTGGTFSKCKSARSVRLRIKKDPVLSQKLDAWVKRDIHLEQYELGCRRRSRNARINAMRVWLHDLRQQYAHVIIKNSSHSDMKDHKKAVADNMLPKSRYQAHHAAPGEVIEEICRYFNREKNVQVISAVNTTATCHICNDDILVTPARMLHCERCGCDYDRDIISTRNMMIKKGETTEKPAARKTKAKFEKRHGKKEQQQQWQLNAL